MEITCNSSHPVSVRNIYQMVAANVTEKKPLLYKFCFDETAELRRAEAIPPDILWALIGNRLPIGGGTRLN